MHNSVSRVLSFKITWKSLFVLSFGVFLFSELFNGYAYGADIKYIIIPAAVCTALSLFCARDKSLKDYVPMLLFALSALVSSVLSNSVPFRVANCMYFVMIATILLISSVSFDRNEIRFVFSAYCFTCIVASGLLFWSYCTGSNLLEGRATLSYFGVNKDQNYTAAYLAFGFYVFLMRAINSDQLKGVNTACMLFILAAIYLTGSRAGLLSVVLAAMVCLVTFFATKGSIRKKMAVAYFAVFLAFIAISVMSGTELFSRMGDMSGYTDNVRLTIWSGALQGFYRSPIIGEGLYSSAYYSLLGSQWVTHNSFLDILIDQGIVGITLIGIIFFQFVRGERTNGLFVLGMLICFFMPLFFCNGYETYTFWLPMAICMIVSHYCKNGSYTDLFDD